MRKKTDKTKYAIIAALVVYIIWGFTFLASKVAQKWVTPFILMAYRFDLAALLLALPMVFGWRKVKLRGKKIGRLILMGLFEPCLYFIGEQYGVRFTNSAFSGVMIAIIPIVTILLASVFLKDRPSSAQVIFCILSIAGIIIISLSENKDGAVSLKGILCLLVAVFTGSAYTVVSRGLSDEFTVYERTLVMEILGAVFFTCFALLENHNNLKAIIEPLRYKDVVLAIVYLAVFASVIGYTLFNYAVSNAPMAKVVVLCNLTTVISVLAGIVLLGDPFTPVSLIAMIIVLIGIWGVQKY